MREQCVASSGDAEPAAAEMFDTADTEFPSQPSSRLQHTYLCRNTEASLTYSTRYTGPDSSPVPLSTALARTLGRLARLKPSRAASQAVQKPERSATFSLPFAHSYASDTSHKRPIQGHFPAYCGRGRFFVGDFRRVTLRARAARS